MTLPIEKPIKRIVGQIRGKEGGPLLILCAGIHGNEPAGLIAIREVLDHLSEHKDKINGTVLGVAGNLEGLSKGQRFIHRDLNRLWRLEQIQHIQAMPEEHLQAEFRDLREITDLVDEFRAIKHSDFLFMDLHTTSAKGGVFSFCNKAKHAFARAMDIGVPVISNITERLKGTSINYFEELDLPAIGFEAGQNEEPSAVDRAIGAIAGTLISMGIANREDLQALLHNVDELKAFGDPLPKVIDLCYRHPVRINDGFRMREGFGNFEAIQKDQVLAEDQNGAIRAKEDGYLLMPLYQSQGTDGFFIVKEVH